MTSFRRAMAWLILVVVFQTSPEIMAANQAPPGSSKDAPVPVSAPDDETWKKEFEDVCARAGDQEGLSMEELKALLVRCDSLKAVIEGLEESTRKVYLTRIQACRDLYRYMLDAKTAGGAR